MTAARFAASVLAWLLATGLLASPSAASLTGDEWELSSILPEEYNRAVPPGLAVSNDTTVVDVSLFIQSIDSITEETMSFTCDMYFNLMWKDPRLNFPEKFTRHSQALPLDWLGHIWVPEVQISNAEAIRVNGDLPNKKLVVEEKGKALVYEMKFIADITCPLDLRRYPHDSQTCKIKVESLSAKLNEVKLEWHDKHCVTVFKDATASLPKLDLIGKTVSTCDTRDDGAVDSYGCLESSFTFQRRLGHFFINGYLPTVVIVGVSWYSFWLKPENTLERISLGITTLLTIYSQRVILSRSLPVVSYLKAIDLFTLVSTFFVFLSILQFAVISVIIKDYKKGDRDKKQKSEDPRLLGSSTSTVNSGGGGVSMNLEGGGGRGRKEKLLRERMRKYEWAIRIDRFSRVTVPATYIALNVVYWAVYYDSLPGETLGVECRPDAPSSS